LTQIATTLQTLPDIVKSSQLASDVDKLVADLSTDTRAELASLKDTVSQIRNAVQSISELRNFPTTVTLDSLPLVADRLLGTAAHIQTIAGLSNWAETLPNLIPERLRATETQLLADATALANTLRTALTAPALTFLNDVKAQLQELSRQVGLTGQLSDSAHTFSARARVVDAGVSFDTRLDLTTIAAERHPGNLVYIQTAVRRSDPGGLNPQTLFEGRRTFRLEKYGWYSETRGALLFVQPTTATRNISFQPVPAVGYYWHHGRRNKPGWNHELAPAFGFSLALLDFDDAHDFELGIGVGATVFRDIFSLGAGRNLQARRSYYYVGINPLAIVGLFRQ
jgi:hypothetical protein